MLTFTFLDRQYFQVWKSLWVIIKITLTFLCKDVLKHLTAEHLSLRWPKMTLTFSVEECFKALTAEQLSWWWPCPFADWEHCAAIHSTGWRLQEAHGRYVGKLHTRAAQGHEPNRQGQDVPDLCQVGAWWNR